MEDCIEWLWARALNGYGVLRWEGKNVYAHRLAYCQSKDIALESIKGLLVRHSCDNRGCVNPDHLSVGSHKDNAEDMVSKGRQCQGVEVTSAKLTEDQVKQIRRSYQRGVTSAQTLAKQFGVGHTTIFRAVKRKTWDHIPEEDAGE